jgi:hypothetical protein
LFGAQDIDVYPLDLKALAAKVAALQLPLILCRTKSGGAHLYLFLQEPCPAQLVRARLREWSNALGFKSDTEIFPKQERLTPDSDGSWINAPYQSGNRSTRYALDQNGNALTPEGFIEGASKAALTRGALEAFSISPTTAKDNDDDFESGPPCLQTLAVQGFGDWQNQGLFNVAVYLHKRYGEGWSAHLETYNTRYMHPPEPPSGVLNIIKSVSKRKYFFTCKQEPICSVCDKKTCATREFGVGGLPNEPGAKIGEFVKLETEPPSYIIEVNKIRIDCDIEDLLDQRRFRKHVAMRLNLAIKTIKADDWDDVINDRFSRMEIIEVPDAATHEGQFWILVQKFCTNSKLRGKYLDEITLEKPYTEGDRTYFRPGDLYQYLAKQRFNSITEKDVFGWVRKRGFQEHSTILKGQETAYWSIPAFTEQTEEFAVPRAPLPERM